MRSLYVLLGLALSLPAAADVFQWTDEYGHLQMSDHPPPGNSHVKVIKSGGGGAPASAAGSSSSADVAKRQDEALKAMQGKQEDVQKAKQEADAKASASAASCADLLRQQTILKSGGRLLTFDSNGQRQYLSNDEIQQKLQDTNQQLQENHCN